MKETTPETAKENWTKFPNNILDNLHLFTSAEFKVLSLMVRKNIGYKHPNKKFAVDYIVTKIKMGNPTVQKAIKGLLKKESIIKVGKKHNVFLYDILWKVPKEINTEKSKHIRNLYGSIKETYTEPYKKLIAVKDNIIKDNIIIKNNIAKSSDLAESPILENKSLKKEDSISPILENNISKNKYNILKKEFGKFDFLENWNNLKNPDFPVNPSRHKIPEHSPASKSTNINKNVKTSFKYIDLLLEGKFFGSVVLDKIFLSKHNLDKTSFDNISQRDILRAINRYGDYFKPGNFPENKTNLPKSMSQFFYNERSNTSMFILCLKKGSFTSKQSKIDNEEMSLEMIIEFKSNFPNMSEKEIKEILFNLYTWHCNLPDKLFETHNPFYKHFGGFQDLRIEYQNYLSSRVNETMCISSLSPTGKWFNFFKKDIFAGKYGIDIK